MKLKDMLLHTNSELSAGVHKVNSITENGVTRYVLELLQDTFNVSSERVDDPDDIMYTPTFIWNRFANAPHSIGVIMVGKKGTGKTEDASVICNIAISQGVPVIFVSGGITVTVELIHFLTKYNDVVIFIDEFAKIIKQDMQDAALTLFNDTAKTKRLFILTENDKRLISQFFLSRPGRIEFYQEYGRASENKVKAFCHKQGISEAIIDEILKLHARLPDFSIDHVRSIIELWKNTNATIDEIISVINIPEARTQPMYRIVDACDTNGVKYTCMDKTSMPLSTVIGEGRNKWVTFTSVSDNPNDTAETTDDTTVKPYKPLRIEVRLGKPQDGNTNRPNLTISGDNEEIKLIDVAYDIISSHSFPEIKQVTPDGKPVKLNITFRIDS